MNSSAAHPGSLEALKSANGGFYNAAVAKTFFESHGQRNQISAGTVLFEENEKSNKQGLFEKPLNKALTTPINQNLFAKRNIHRMYFLAEGSVELTAGGRLLETVWPGDVFGEMAVISEIPDLEIASARSATATAKSDCVAYSLDGPETQAGLAKTPEFALMLMSVMFERLRFLAARLAARATADDHRSLKSEPVFESAMLASLQEKLERSTTARFAEGAKIMKEGAPGTAMYVVLEGRVAIAIGRRIVEKLSIGGVFGEMALVDQSPRTATAVARTDCTMLAINRDALMALVKSDPAIGMAMMRAVAQRVRYMNSLFN